MIEYLEVVEEPVEMIHVHKCDECEKIITDLCSEDCDNDTYETCDECSAEVHGEEIPEIEEIIKDELKDVKL